MKDFLFHSMLTLNNNSYTRPNNTLVAVNLLEKIDKRFQIKIKTYFRLCSGK